MLSDEVGTEASIISKVKSTRKLVHSFQLNFAYNPPKNYKGSCLDGRDITYNIVPDADFTRTFCLYRENNEMIYVTKQLLLISVL